MDHGTGRAPLGAGAYNAKWRVRGNHSLNSFCRSRVKARGRGAAGQSMTTHQSKRSGMSCAPFRAARSQPMERLRVPPAFLAARGWPASHSRWPRKRSTSRGIAWSAPGAGSCSPPRPCHIENRQNGCAQRAWKSRMAAQAARSSQISGKSNALARPAYQDPPEHQEAQKNSFRGDERQRGRPDCHHFPQRGFHAQRGDRDHQQPL